MDSRFPTLDLLERHGLRSAYVLLLLGAGSWRHFQNLHDKNIPETCRLPRNLLLALKGEYKRMVGGNARRYDDTDTEILLDEFNRARGKNDLRELYLQRLNDRIKGNSDRLATELGGSDEIGWSDQAVIGVHYDRKVFVARWREMEVRLHLVVKASGRVLLVDIDVPVDLTAAGADAFAESAHPSLVKAVFDASKQLSFRHKFGLKRGEMTPYHNGGEFIMIDDNGVEHLRLLLADVGVTDVTTK